MKISKIFHWLYFTVMMLPCVIIPIFAIYTRNENYNSNIEVQVEQNKVVDFNQLAQPRDDDFTNNGITYTAIPGGYNCNGTATAKSDPYLNIGWSSYMELKLNHKYLFKGLQSDTLGSLSTFCWRLQMRVRGTTIDYYQYNDFGSGTIIHCNYSNNEIGLYVQISNGQTVDFNVFPTLIDLTQMFGVGNEPTIEQFNTYYTNAYYPYNESEEQVIENYQTITYNDTDVGSQFLYTLYNATDKYFNFDNFFGLDNVYSWIQLNWFCGNAPLGFAIFWHFFTYWLLASLAWLLFDLMVYVPLYIHRWLDKGAIE